MHACMLNHFSHVQLFATPWTVARQAPLSMGILQERTLEWVAMPFSRGSSQPRARTQVSHISGGFCTVWATREAHRTDCVDTSPAWTCGKVRACGHPRFTHVSLLSSPGHTGRLLKSLCFTSLSFLLLHIIFHITLASLEAQHRIAPGYNCEYDGAFLSCCEHA